MFYSVDSLLFEILAGVVWGSNFFSIILSIHPHISVIHQVMFEIRGNSHTISK